MNRPEPAPRLVRVLPNLLSTLRLGLTLLFPLLPAWRLPIVLAGGLSDWLDGQIARTFGVKSVSGALLDAVADKAFALCVLVTLTVTGQIHWWQVVLVLLRDAVVAAVAAYSALERNWRAFQRMMPALPGKLTTLVLFGWFVALLAPRLERLALPLFVLAGLCSAWTAAEYGRRFARALRERRA
jgi:cardiolipin synthase